MPTPESIREAYDRGDPAVRDVGRYVRETLEPYCRAQKYLFTDRFKTKESLTEKLEGGRIDAWSKIDDLYACTIVVPVATHEAGVLRKLTTSFDQVDSRTRAATKKAPDVFRFDGTRWYGKLRSEATQTRQPGVGDLTFEVQVITAFEYAWIAVTHDLVYKSDSVDWRRQRLAAQLKAAVEQVEVLIGAFETASDAVAVSAWPETDAKSAIIERFKLLVADGSVPESILPTSWRRFADNVFALVVSYEKSRYKVPAAVDKLLGVMETELRQASPTVLPNSGTLFQYVVSVVAREDTDGSIAEFTLVPSRELSDLYGVVSNLPRAFTFDGVSATSGLGAASQKASGDTAS